MKTRLLHEILDSIQSDDELLKSRLILILDKYDITEKETQLVEYDNNEIEKYIKLFLVNKKVSGRTDKTLRHYQITLQKFFDNTGKNPKDITGDDIKLYLALMSLYSLFQSLILCTR